MDGVDGSWGMVGGRGVVRCRLLGRAGVGNGRAAVLVPVITLVSDITCEATLAPE